RSAKLAGDRSRLLGIAVVDRQLSGLGRNRLATGNSAAGYAPQIHGRIGSPGAPGFSAALQFAVAAKAEGAQKSDVAGGEGVGFAQRAHSNVLRRPSADARELT